MVWVLELSSLGAGYPYGPVDYDDGADIVANITRKAVSKGPSIPETYAGYDNSVCFVEPMVRALDRPRPVGCYSDWRPASDVSACRAANLARVPPSLSPPRSLRPRPSPSSRVAGGLQGAEAVMFIFIAGVVLGAVPQYLKLILLANSEGISLTSLALMNVSNVTATLNIFILHFEQIKQCVRQADGFTFDSCQASLLTFYYTLVYTLLWFPLYPLAAHFCAEKKVEHCGYVASQRAGAPTAASSRTSCRASILAAPVVRMVLNGGCFGFESYAMLLGVMNAVLEATRYLPQVFASWHSDGSSALSYLRLLLSIGGGVGATVQKALMKEDISTWFPPARGALAGDCHRRHKPL